MPINPGYRAYDEAEEGITRRYVALQAQGLLNQEELGRWLEQEWRNYYDRIFPGANETVPQQTPTRGRYRRGACINREPPTPCPRECPCRRRNMTERRPTIAERRRSRAEAAIIEQFRFRRIQRERNRDE